MTLTEIDVATKVIVGIIAATGALAGAWKVLWRGKKDQDGIRRPGLIKGVLLDIRGFRDAILGREPVVDSITGLEISPRLPDIGTRMANQEQQMAVLTEAVAAIAQSNRRLDDHEQRLSALEEQRLERVVSRAEVVQLLSTMEAAVGADPQPKEHPS